MQQAYVHDQKCTKAKAKKQSVFIRHSAPRLYLKYNIPKRYILQKLQEVTCSVFYSKSCFGTYGKPWGVPRHSFLWVHIPLFHFQLPALLHSGCQSLPVPYRWQLSDDSWVLSSPTELLPGSEPLCSLWLDDFSFINCDPCRQDQIDGEASAPPIGEEFNKMKPTYS